MWGVGDQCHCPPGVRTALCRAQVTAGRGEGVHSWPPNNVEYVWEAISLDSVDRSLWSSVEITSRTNVYFTHSIQYNQTIDVYFLPSQKSAATSCCKC